MRARSFSLTFALTSLAALAGCTQPGTGVALTVAGALTVDHLLIAASYAGRTVTREVPVPAGTALPTTLLAELPDDTVKVTFDVTGLDAGQIVGRASSPPVDVEAHHIAAVTVTLGGAPGDGSAAGDGDGAAPLWTVERGGPPLLGAALTGVWSSGANVYVTSALAAGANLLRSTDGGRHFTPSLAAPSSQNLNAVWGAGSADVFLVGDGGVILHGSGASFTAMTDPAGTPSLYAVWGTSATDAYAVGSGNTILHLVTGGWVLQTAVGATVLRGVWGSGANLYAVGSGGTILHSSGTSWTPQTSNTAVDLYGVWGAGGELWAVGDGGTVLRSTGDGQWAPQTSGLPSAIGLASIWGSSAADVYAVGSGWTILHSAGGGVWTTQASTLTVGNLPQDRFNGVFGTSAIDIFIVGAGETVLHHP